MTRRPFSIEPLDISPEKMEQLKEMISQRQKLNSHVINMALQSVSGKCMKCGWLASTVLKFRVYGVIKIERYCDECLLKCVPSIKINNG